MAMVDRNAIEYQPKLRFGSAIAHVDWLVIRPFDSEQPDKDRFAVDVHDINEGNVLDDSPQPEFVHDEVIFCTIGPNSGSRDGAHDLGV